MSLIDNLPHYADIGHIEYEQLSTGLGGEQEVTAAPYAVDEPAWFQVLSAETIRAYAQRNQIVTHAVYFSRDPGLRLADRITAKDGAIACPYAGQTFQIMAFAEATAGMGRAWKVITQIEREP